MSEHFMILLDASDAQLIIAALKMDGSVAATRLIERLKDGLSSLTPQPKGTPLA